MEDLKENKGSKTTSSGIYVIEVNLSTFVSWVLDTGCGSHICVNVQGNQVWTLIDPPNGLKTIGCKWVFKKKTDMDGNVHTFKARLVAKCFKQTHGVDYDETFSPVAMLKSIRILLAIAA